MKTNPLEKLANLCGYNSTQTTTTTTSHKSFTLDEEISAYIDAAQSASDFPQFWTSHHQSLPRLSHLVRRVNIIPATSVASESLFSTASFLNRKQRSSLSSRSLRYLLVLKGRHIIDKLE